MSHGTERLFELARMLRHGGLADTGLPGCAFAGFRLATVMKVRSSWMGMCTGMIVPISAPPGNEDKGPGIRRSPVQSTAAAGGRPSRMRFAARGRQEQPPGVRLTVSWSSPVGAAARRLHDHGPGTSPPLEALPPGRGSRNPDRCLTVTAAGIRMQREFGVSPPKTKNGTRRRQLRLDGGVARACS